MALIDTLEKTVRTLAVKATASMQNILSRTLAKPIDTGGIFSKCGLTVTRNGETITVETDLPDYAYWTDKGRRAGKMPPEKPIKDWVKKHNISEAAVFPIRRKIAEKGTKATNFTTPLQRMIEMIQKSVSIEAVTVLSNEVYEEAKTLKDIDIKL